jgi:hypothetical protein
MHKKARRLKLEMTQSIVLGEARTLPGAPDVARLAHIEETKSAVRLYANASFHA